MDPLRDLSGALFVPLFPTGRHVAELRTANRALSSHRSFCSTHAQEGGYAAGCAVKVGPMARAWRRAPDGALLTAPDRSADLAMKVRYRGHARTQTTTT